MTLKKFVLSARFAGFVAVAIFAFVRLWDPAPLTIARNTFFDFLQRAHPRLVEDYPVTIVDVDDKSLAKIGQWPWPRSILANLVGRLSESGAAVIGFDMIFPEKDRLSPQNLAQLFPAGDDGFRQTLAAMPDNDALFAAAIKESRVVLGRTVVSNRFGAAPQHSEKVASKASIATIGGDPGGDLVRVPAPLTSLPILENAAAGFGMLTVQPERDGIVRRAPMLLQAGDSPAPGLAIELLRVASGATSFLVKRDAIGIKSVAVAGVEIPTDRDGQIWVAFARHDAARFVSAADVLSGEAASERLQGKVVLIGTSAEGLFDLRSTPLDSVIPGVEIHAQIIESLLGETALNRPYFALGAEIAMAAALGIALVVAAPLVGALANLLIGAVIAGLLLAACWYLFVYEKILIDVSYPLASSVAVFLLMTFINYLREERRRTRIRAAFQQYLSPDLVEQLIRDPSRLVLGGETRNMSILFSDVRGFTSIAETFKSNPAGLTALMNRMLTSLSMPIIERRGTIDKYIGDAIMAFWNAPLDDPNHAVNACDAALELLHRLDRLNDERRKEAAEAGTAFVPMEIGVGISTGLSVVGNMGSELRFDYSVLGDSVNLASRLESLTAVYGLRTLVCAETARGCLATHATLEVDRVRVKGKKDPETVFTLLGGNDLAIQDRFKLFQGEFAAMLAHYRAKDWGQARAHLDRCRQSNRVSHLSKLLDIYAARIARFSTTPPGPDWDGVFQAHATASVA
jgi:adenylate cyclase